MRTSSISALLILFSLSAAGCAASSDTSSDPASDPAESDVSGAGHVTGKNAQVLMDALQKANAPSSTPPGMLGVGSRVARVEVTTAQGGMAHFISRNAELSTLDGDDLGGLVSLGLDWDALSGALQAGGLEWQTEQGEHGASSSRMFAKVECKQVVAPSAKPTCTVAPIVVTQADSKTLMQLLMNANAPSDTPPGMLGVGSRVARVTLKTAQGGMAHFISEQLEVATLDGKALGDIASLDTAWADAKGALLDGGAVWKTTNGAHGASSSEIVATVECKQVVAPKAQPTCTVSPEAIQ